MGQDLLTPQIEQQMAAKLRDAGLRVTKPRLALAYLLFGTLTSEGTPHARHVTAEALHAEARAMGLSVSQATIYNTLNQFCQAGLLNEVQVSQTRSYFDTNLSDHHHFYVEEEGRLIDIDQDEISLAKLPDSPSGFQVNGVDIIIRLQK